MSHSFFSEARETRPLIKPGATFKMQSGREIPSVTAAVFEDGTFEGDASTAAGLIQQKNGGAAFARLAAAAVRDAVAKSKSHTELIAAIEIYVEKLPEPPGDSTPPFREGWKMVRQDFVRDAAQSRNCRA